MGLSLALVIVALAVALALRPWRALRGAQLWHPLFASLVLMPWLWAAQRFMPGGVAVQLSGACLMVLMLGWPLAVLSLVPIAALGAWLGGIAWPQALDHLAWNGIVTATLALAIGLATRRWLPRHPFVFILGRGFLVTALATVLSGALSALVSPLPPGSELGSILLGHWLMAWGEAFATGMLVAIFVAFKPEWLATWSDARYLTDA
ncbi:MAG TPA: energy-coupling factor ABC transporter permease [Piscinibacter sp.]|uniref:energy-coupling factor ABC transporter permease n=1 Tax=Piscinibacter sp. TaxID=1903157 RepID=UPI002B6CAB4A|nr:energy-coupling factor ABC transporter permease [Piscinibacter sp.]